MPARRLGPYVFDVPEDLIWFPVQDTPPRHSVSATLGRLTLQYTIIVGGSALEARELANLVVTGFEPRDHSVDSCSYGGLTFELHRLAGLARHAETAELYYASVDGDLVHLGIWFPPEATNKDDVRTLALSMLSGAIQRRRANTPPS
jgi:hypothetical protein